MTKKTGKKDKQLPKQKEIKEVEVKETPDTTNDIEGDLNSGFSSYLQSSSGNIRVSFKVHSTFLSKNKTYLLYF